MFGARPDIGCRGSRWMFDVSLLCHLTDWRINFFINSVVYRVLACRKCNQVKQGETPATTGNRYGTKMRPKWQGMPRSTKRQHPSSIEAPIPKRQDRCVSLQGDRFGDWHLNILWCLDVGIWCFRTLRSRDFALHRRLFQFFPRSCNKPQQAATRCNTPAPNA